MAKPFISSKWSEDDFRLMVVLFLTVIYPVFMLSFFSLYIFVLLPLIVQSHYDSIPKVKTITQDGWYHFYWLFVSLLWLLLCAVSLPCFQNKKKGTSIQMENVENSYLPTKSIDVEAFVQTEEINLEEHLSSIKEKSQDSSISTEKRDSEEKTDSEHKKSRESLDKSDTLTKQANTLETGKFTDECISTLKCKNMNEVMIEYEVHREKNKEDKEPDSMNKLNKKNIGTEEESDSSDTSDGKMEEDGEIMKKHFKNEVSESSDSSDEEVKKIEGKKKQGKKDTSESNDTSDEEKEKNRNNKDNPAKKDINTEDEKSDSNDTPNVKKHSTPQKQTEEGKLDIEPFVVKQGISQQETVSLEDATIATIESPVQGRKGDLTAVTPRPTPHLETQNAEKNVVFLFVNTN